MVSLAGLWDKTAEIDKTRRTYRALFPRLKVREKEIIPPYFETAIDPRRHHRKRGTVT
jgi:hypothetical protein